MEVDQVCNERYHILEWNPVPPDSFSSNSILIRSHLGKNESQEVDFSSSLRPWLRERPGFLTLPVIYRRRHTWRFGEERRRLEKANMYAKSVWLYFSYYYVICIGTSEVFGCLVTISIEFPTGYQYRFKNKKLIQLFA